MNSLLKYKISRFKKYYDRKRLFRYFFLKIIRGYKILNETNNQRRIKIKSNGLLFEYPTTDISYEISCNPQNEILVDSYIDIKEGTFIDVGAFIGKYTIKVGKNPKVKVLAIEPNPFSFELLMNNIRVNSLHNNVIALNCALGDSENKILNFLDNYAMSKITDSEDNSTIKVKTKLLSNIINEYLLKPPYLIKIDTEGYELKILKSFEDFLAKDYILNFVIEILPQSNDKDEIINLMFKHNFECEQIDYANFFFSKN